ncbi:MAG: T9SS type A sorting domain-containing protein [Candidatus Eisenbacteria bacterium]|nr:T9SS type A sorting domain-containing protein [Candidatus Eisenbacteria bacterium]
MKNISFSPAGYLFFCLLFCTLFVGMSFSPAEAQIRIFTKTLDAGVYDVASSMTRTYDGGFAVAGATMSYGAGLTDIFISRFDRSGDHVWTRTLGGTGYDEVYSVWQSLNNELLVTGSTTSYGAGGLDLILSKFNSSGDLAWTKTLGGSGADYGRSVIHTFDGGFVVTGATSSYGAGNYDLLLSRFDTSGNRTWTRTLGGSDRECGFSVIQTMDEGYVVTGYTRSYGAGSADLILSKFNDAGTHLWTKTLGGIYDEEGRSVIETSDGSLVVTGYTRSYGAGSSDIIISKFTSSGTHVWSRTVGSTVYDYGHSVIEASDGSLILAGSVSEYGAGSDDAALLKFGASGDLLWTKAIGGSSVDVAYSLAQAVDGGLLVAGYTQSYGAGNSCVLISGFDCDGNGCSGVFVLPTVTAITPTVASRAPSLGSPIPTVTTPSPSVGIEVASMTTACETETFAEDMPPAMTKPQVSAFRIGVASPVSSHITANLSLLNATAVNLTIYDVSGRMIGQPYRFSEMRAGNHTLEIPASHLKSGAYLIVLEGAGLREMVKVVKVR